jgi:hypothetical protein
MNDRTEEAIRLLTRLARGDVSLVGSALLKHERDGVEKVIAYVKANRAAPGPGGPSQTKSGERSDSSESTLG